MSPGPTKATTPKITSRARWLPVGCISGVTPILVPLSFPVELGHNLEPPGRGAEGFHHSRVPNHPDALFPQTQTSNVGRVGGEESRRASRSRLTRFRSRGVAMLLIDLEEEGDPEVESRARRTRWGS